MSKKVRRISEGDNEENLDPAQKMISTFLSNEIVSHLCFLFYKIFVIACPWQYLSVSVQELCLSVFVAAASVTC